MKILLAEQTTASTIPVSGKSSADTPNVENRWAALVYIFMRSVLSVIPVASPVAHGHSMPVSEGRRSGVPHVLTPGGLYTSFRSSIWKIATSSFRAVATIASFELLRFSNRL